MPHLALADHLYELGMAQMAKTINSLLNPKTPKPQNPKTPIDCENVEII